jgi:hypothetical protein
MPFMEYLPYIMDKYKVSIYKIKETQQYSKRRGAVRIEMVFGPFYINGNSPHSPQPLKNGKA